MVLVKAIKFESTPENGCNRILCLVVDALSCVTESASVRSDRQRSAGMAALSSASVTMPRSGDGTDNSGRRRQKRFYTGIPTLL